MSKTMEKIYESAVELFASKGFPNTKVDMIAGNAGVAVGTIYNYFKSKDEILQFIFIREHDKRIKYLNTLKETDISALEKILKFFKFHLDLFDDNRSIGRVVVQETIMNARGTEKKVEIDGIRKALTEIVQCGINNGEIRQCNARMVMEIIGCSCEALAFSSYFMKDIQEYNELKAEFLYGIRVILKQPEGTGLF